MTRTSIGTGRPTNRRHHALLQRPQQLGLHGEVHVADLVQEQRAALRLAERAGAVGDGAGERPADVAEQQAFQQFGRDRRAVHRHERPLARLP